MRVPKPSPSASQRFVRTVSSRAPVWIAAWFLTTTFGFAFASMAATPEGEGEAAGEVVGEVDSEAAALFLTAHTGFDYSRGDYGLDRTSHLYFVPLGLTLDYAAWRFTLSLPFLYSDGVTRGNAVPGPNPADRRRESEDSVGLGELTTGASYLVAPANEAMPWLELGGQILWPSRTDEDLGAGGFGFAVQVDVWKTFGRVSPFARVGRNFFLVRSLDDRFFTSVGASVEWAERTSVGLSYDWLESVARGLDDAHELVGYASFGVSEAWTLGPYAVLGLSDGSPDFGVGLSIRYALGGYPVDPSTP